MGQLQKRYQRESLSVFKACYGFIERFRGCQAAVWPEVRAELEAFRGLLPLLEADWDLRWDDVVTATDAAPDGYGECTSTWGGLVAAEHGRVRERARFRRTAGGARQRATPHAGYQ